MIREITHDPKLQLLIFFIVVGSASIVICGNGCCRK